MSAEWSNWLVWDKIHIWGQKFGVVKAQIVEYILDGLFPKITSSYTQQMKNLYNKLLDLDKKLPRLTIEKRQLISLS